MKNIFLLIVFASVGLADEITLKSGVIISGVSIIEINNQLIRYHDIAGNEQRSSLRDISDVLVQSNSQADTVDRIFLRNGDVMSGTVTTLEYDRAVIITTAGDSAEYEPPSVLKVTGSRSAFSFHSVDDKYFFLTGTHITFVGGKPTKSLTQSQYRFIFSLFSSLPSASFSFNYPNLVEEKAKAGYGISFSIDYTLASGNDLSFSYRFMQNTIGSPDSLPGSFSEWSNHILFAGIKRYAVIDGPIRIYGEGKIGYGVSMPPEHHDLSSDQSSGFAWSIGGGIYLTENISLDAVYLLASPEVTMTMAFPYPRQVKTVIKQQKVSAILAGISYTFGSGN